MKAVLALSALVMTSLLATSSAWAAGQSSTRYTSVTNENKADQIGVGIGVGSFTGISGQYWLSDERAVNAMFAAERGNAAVSLAHVWLFPGTFAEMGRHANFFVPYVGVGGTVVFGTQPDYYTRGTTDNMATAVQVPLGIEFLPVLQRFDIFAELAPMVEVTPIAVGFLTGDLGARFYF